MKCRKNLRVLFAQYNSASPADRPATALMKLKTAILDLKNPALHPSLLISRPDVAAAIANDIAMGMLGPGSTLVSRYDDFVWAHHQVMMQGPNDPSGFFALPCIALCRSSSASRLNILTILGHCCGASAIGFDISGLGLGFGALTGFGGLSDRMPTFGAARLPVVRLRVFIFAPGTCSRGVRSRRAFRHSRMASRSNPISFRCFIPSSLIAFSETRQASRSATPSSLSGGTRPYSPWYARQ